MSWQAEEQTASQDAATHDTDEVAAVHTDIVDRSQKGEGEIVN